MSLSALAREIKDDLGREFAAGATVAALREWLGEPPGPIKDALRELLESGAVFRVGHAFFDTSRPPADAPATALHRAEIERRLALRCPYRTIAADLGVTHGVVQTVARTRRRRMLGADYVAIRGRPPEQRP